MTIGIEAGSLPHPAAALAATDMKEAKTMKTSMMQGFDRVAISLCLMLAATPFLALAATATIG